MTSDSLRAWQIATGGIGLQLVRHVSPSPTPRRLRRQTTQTYSLWSSEPKLIIRLFAFQYVRFIRRNPRFVKRDG